MTIECAIKELKEDIDLYIPLHGTIDDVDRELPDGRLITALEVAIASLEAWEKVRQEINDLFEKPACYIPNYDAYKMFLEIIDKHLREASPTGAEGSEKND